MSQLGVSPQAKSITEIFPENLDHTQTIRVFSKSFSGLKKKTFFGYALCTSTNKTKGGPNGVYHKSRDSF
jgi:hypothetical protein